jgi:hypothetical protein
VGWIVGADENNNRDRGCEWEDDREDGSTGTMKQRGQKDGDDETTGTRRQQGTRRGWQDNDEAPPIIG